MGEISVPEFFPVAGDQNKASGAAPRRRQLRFSLLVGSDPVENCRTGKRGRWGVLGAGYSPTGLWAEKTSSISCETGTCSRALIPVVLRRAWYKTPYHVTRGPRLPATDRQNRVDFFPKNRKIVTRKVGPGMDRCAALFEHLHEVPTN